MTPPTGLLDKGTAIEEWIDLHFFRPLGLRLVRRLAPTRISADQVTGAAVAVGLLAGHLFLYRSIALNLAGLALFLVSDVLDSADGQLARLRGSSTLLGAILDGAADNVRFINLYIHLVARLILSHAMTPEGAIGLAALAGVCHSLQSAVADFLRQVYLFITTGRGRLDLPEDLDRGEAPKGLGRLTLLFYGPYVRRQARWCPKSAAAVRAVRRGTGEARHELAVAWQRTQARNVARCALIAQNVRFLLLALTACVGWPEGFFWLTLIPVNAALIWILVSHEHNAGRLLRSPALTGSLASESL